MSLACIPRDIIVYATSTSFLLRVSMCPKSCENVCLLHDMLQSVIVSGAVIYHTRRVPV